MSLKLGPFQIDSIQTGLFRLDGGAMFGVVPKTLWSKYIEPDELNRIPMGMRSLVIRSSATNRIYLIDTGAGHKGDEKFNSIYSIDFSQGDIESGLKGLGLTPDDITDVMFTHLHFDHGGGATRYKPGTTEPELVFRHARHWVTPDHLETALHPNAREKASFLKDNVQPVVTSPLLHLIEEGEAYEPGLESIWVHGHTLGMQLPLIKADGKTILFAADLFPTYAHVPLPWVMGYDMQPLRTLTEKASILSTIVEQNWYVFLEHDAHHEIVTLSHDGKSYKADRFLTLNEV